MKSGKTRVVSETNLGIYVWALPDGTYLADDDANVLSINAMRNDLLAMANISKVAKNLGFEGRPVFLEGRRKITDEELQEQIYRASIGLVPDPLDIGVYKEEMRRSR